MLSYDLRDSNASVHLRVRVSDVNLHDIDVAQESKVDNTGNVCIWPSEEVLLRYLLSLPAASWHAQRVLELGAGATALAGVALAARRPQLAHVCVTDGNPLAAEGLELNVRANAPPGVSLTSALLKWDRTLTVQQLVDAGYRRDP